MNAINEFRGKYFFLSNFYQAPITYQNLVFENNEAAFQAAKCPDRMNEFCGLNPSEAKRLGRHVELRSDWEEIKDEVMYQVCKAKFMQHDELRQRLIDTGNAELIEGNTWGDKTWGVCDGVGENRLGKILMRIRTEINNACNVCIDIPNGAARIINTLEQHGFEAYVVGGCVRDSMLGITPKDWDICTSARPKEVESCFISQRIIETGIQHGTITIIMSDGQYEVTTFRNDGDYSDSRHPDSVRFVNDVQTDLARRDFTVNAMAYNPRYGLIDPFDGKSHLEHKTLACVGDAGDRFAEDALRIMRALRFASTYGFIIEEKTSDSIHQNAERLNNIAVERINTELCRLLCGENVLSILTDYSDIITTIIPELKPCIGFEQHNPYHQYTIYDHIAHAVANYNGKDTTTKMALLLHDIGKPLCYTEDEKGGHFYGHGVPGHDIAEKIVSRLRFDKCSQYNISELVLYHDSVIEPTIKTVKRWLNKVGIEQFLRLLDIRIADILAHTEGTQESRIEKYTGVREIAEQIIAEEQCFTLKDLAINGTDILSAGVPEGREVGLILNKLLEQVIDGEIQNNREVLMNYVKTYIRGELDD